MNQKTVLVLVAIIAIVGIVVTAASVAAPALATEILSNKERDTKNNRNSAEIRSSQEIDNKPLGGGDHPHF
jgi:hypothetical protein